MTPATLTGEFKMKKQTGFYVTLKDGPKTCWLLGPFMEHEKALAKVDAAVAAANAIDGRVWFMAFGTGSITAETLPAGRLNQSRPDLLA